VPIHPFELALPKVIGLAVGCNIWPFLTPFISVSIHGICGLKVALSIIIPILFSLFIYLKELPEAAYN
jgi:hypothetical protein